jgi:hypothetical protein
MDWLKFYYAKPTPERFVGEVRAIAASDALAKPEIRVVMATFLGRVLAANAGSTAAWLAELSDVGPAMRGTLHQAAWFAQTAEARAWLEREQVDASLLGPAPDLLVGPLHDPVQLDIAWAHYFATGDERAVRRVVSALELMSDVGAAKRFQTTAKTAEDRARAMNDSLFQAASWSLDTLMREHPPLLAICERMFETSELSENEHVALAIVLARVAPERWGVQIDPATNAATVHRKL